MIVHLDKYDTLWVRTTAGTKLVQIQHRRCDAYDEIRYHVLEYKEDDVVDTVLELT